LGRKGVGGPFLSRVPKELGYWKTLLFLRGSRNWPFKGGFGKELPWQEGFGYFQERKGRFTKIKEPFSLEGRKRVPSFKKGCLGLKKEGRFGRNPLF